MPLKSTKIECLRQDQRLHRYSLSTGPIGPCCPPRIRAATGWSGGDVEGINYFKPVSDFLTNSAVFVLG